MTKRIALFPGSFDPFTSGHADLVNRAQKMFDEIIITIAKNSAKQSLFTKEERKEMISELYDDNPQVRVEFFDHLLVDFAKSQDAVAIIRGLRAVSDFEYEMQMALMNRHLAPEVSTVFLMPHEKYTYLNSSIVKEVAKHQGNVQDFVPDLIYKKVIQKLS
jgi:pantetheine-phosphate adenylyltransferase